MHDKLRTSLATSEVVRVEAGRSGRSMAFKVTLEDGVEGYFKPEQRFAAHWYSEVAAYYIDRALGLGRVPPTIGRRLPWAALQKATAGDPRAKEVVVGPDGTVRGSIMWWVPEKLVPVELPKGWESWLSVGAPAANSPFQRLREFQRGGHRTQASRKADGSGTKPVPPPNPPDRAAELADLILFDFLIGNPDRWGGGNTNVRTRGPKGPLVYIDNANGFHLGREPTLHDRAKLKAVQRMRRTTVQAIDGLDFDALRAQLRTDPLGPVLSERHFKELERRQRDILEHVWRMRDQHGPEATPW